ncbi:site-specific integrase [Burkholderia cenocepacia]|uniref:tyrosine-type recombinase/integrase n=1 Tax=Burkholderia cenocepacia TaxID=95486 RepID=UPI001CF3FB6A|nr:site-specific integrase [Burkholderia cenocepacia]MCA7967295.1 site-specific integrase [Burkholderia cenocepacia]
MAARQDLNAPNVYEKRGKGWQVRIQRKGWRVDETFPFVEGNEASRRDAFNRASARANEALQAITAGRSPHIVENREGTLRQAVQRYLDEEVPTHKGKAKEESRIGQLMAPKGGLAGSAMLLDQRLENLHRQDFKDWRDSPALQKREYAPASINQFLSIFSRALAHEAKQPGRAWLANHNMLQDLNLTVEDARERIAAKVEVDSVLAAAGSGPTRLGLRILLETPIRRGDIVALKWDDVSIDGPTHPFAVIRNTKNGTTRAIPLSPGVVEMLRKIPESERYGFLLKSPLNTREKPVAIRADAITRAWIRGRDRVMENNPAIADLRVHDFRHTATTALAKVVHDPLKLSKFTGHKDMRMLARYFHPSTDDLAEVAGWATPKKKQAKRKTPAK